LPSALAIHALLAATGLVASCKEPKDEISTERRTKPSSDGTTVSISPSTKVSCSASEHVEPHLPPSELNENIGGKMVVVKPTIAKPPPSAKGSVAPCKCPPGDPLCDC
jgi:hypothetical protein